MKYAATILVIISLIIIDLVFIYGDIGFDHRGKYGLDFGHFIILSILFVFISFVAIAMAGESGKPWLIGVVVLLVVTPFFPFIKAVLTSL